MGEQPVSSSQAALQAVAGQFDFQLEPPVVAGLLRFVDLLHTWNARINLTGARTVAAIIEEQLPDSFALARLVPAGARLVDVGSGGGLPAIPFGLLRRDVALTLTEPRSRRRAFLATALRELGLVAQLRQERAEALPPGAFQGASARAVLPPVEWLEAGLRLVEPGGQVFVFLGDEPGWVPRAGATISGELRYAVGGRSHRLLAVSAPA
jgi:16S rRNA (guanine527-N7)-methyltransferase